MIRHIVAIDDKRGLAKHGAMPPWHLKQDEKYFMEQTLKYGGQVLMGKKTFIEALHNHPLKDRTNYVVTHDPTPIEGAVVITDLPKFMREWPAEKDLWVIGGAEIFAQTLGQTGELYVTEVEGDFDCDRFYPEYKPSFELVSKSEPITEHGITYTFCVYRSA